MATHSPNFRSKTILSWATVLSTVIGGLVLLQPNAVFAVDGALDTTFNGTGIVTTPIGPGADQGTAVALQSDGKIVVAGYSSNGSNDDFVVVRLNTDGSLDTTFNSTGKVMTAVGAGNDQATAVAIQPDGKIVVAGSSNNGSNYDFAVVRYNSNGSLDTTFNSTGKVTTAIGSGDDQAVAVAIQTDQSITVAGNSDNGSSVDFALVRLAENGSLDPTFNGTGKVTTPVGAGTDLAAAMAVQADGKIVVVGATDNGSNNDFAVVRYRSDGLLDGSFDSDGKLTTGIGVGSDFASAVAIQPDESIVVAGYSEAGSNDDFAVVRYSPNGSLDAAFNLTGKVTSAIGLGNDRATSVRVQSDGKLVIGGFADTGSNDDFAVVRYGSNGSIDTSFMSTGKVATAVGSGTDQLLGLVLQRDHKIVAVGVADNGSNNDFAVVRYDTAMVPGRPTGVVATIGDGQATVSWVAPVDDGGRPISGYAVEADPGGETCVTATLSCTVSDLVNGTAYRFIVVASNAIGDSESSAQSDEFIPATVPGRPTGVVATIGDGQATVSWVAPVDDGGRPISGYAVTADPGGESCVTATLSCTVSDLVNGTAYRFTVVASNAIGDSESSAQSDEFIPATVPDRPTGVVATIGDGQATVSWVAPVDDGGRPISGYAVTADPGGESCVTATLSCTVSDLVNGTAYRFTVVASNAIGDSESSAQSDEFVPATVPGAPVGVAGVAGDGEVTVSWAAPLDDGGLVITGYTVTAIPGDRHCTTATTSCVVTGLTNGGSYRFSVRATNSVGDGALGGPSQAVMPRSAVAPESPGLPSVPQAPTERAGFTPLTLQRLFDTRPTEPQGAVAVIKQRYGGLKVLTVKVTGSAGVPDAGVAAVSLNVTAVDSVGPGFATVFPCGPRPLASNLNFLAGDIVPNLVIAPVSPSGEVCVFASVDTHLVADVNGWFAEGSGFSALVPTRIVDTRVDEPQGSVTVAKHRYGAVAVLTVKVTGAAGVPSASVGAVSLNVTAVHPQGPGFLTVFPCGPRPLASNLNFVTGDVVPNLVIAPVSATGEVCVFASVDTDIVADVTGWFAVGSEFSAMAPTRVFDTRPSEPQGAVAVAKQRYGRTNILRVNVFGIPTIPTSGVRAVSLNVTAADPVGAGYITVFTCGTVPLASNVNFEAGEIKPNSVIAPVSSNGDVCLFASVDTHLVMDVNGWFAVESTR